MGDSASSVAIQWWGIQLVRVRSNDGLFRAQQWLAVEVYKRRGNLFRFAISATVSSSGWPYCMILVKVKGVQQRKVSRLTGTQCGLPASLFRYFARSNIQQETVVCYKERIVRKFFYNPDGVWILFSCRTQDFGLTIAKEQRFLQMFRGDSKKFPAWCAFIFFFIPHQPRPTRRVRKVTIQRS
jgi:hypothetical protein